MIRKIILVGLIVILLLSFCGCSTGKTVLLNEAKQSAVISEAKLSTAEVVDFDFGEMAYKYLEYIQGALPGRLAFSEKEHETAVFILSALLDIGYAPEDIQVQQFSSENNSSPMQAIAPEKAFDGGQGVENSHNIILTKKGDSDKVIIVAAHYDSVGTHGVDDNGSGVAIVLESALRCFNEQTPYTLKFIFFGSEEIGVLGSRVYINALSEKEKQDILFMVNVDTVLAGDICYLYGGAIQSDGTVANDWAVMRAYEAAQELGLDICLPPEGNTDYPFPTGQKRSDHAPFSDNGIPYIYFEANNWNNGNPVETASLDIVLHTENDDLDFINSAFPNRSMMTLTAYSTLLDYILKNPIIQ